MSGRTLKKDPKICVIMSVYNGLPFLKEAVESILNQTYKKFEFIIVDDASRDKTWQFLKSLKDKQSLRSSSASSRTAGLKRIKLIQNKKNLGLAASLNIALRLAQGDFIARMDADDISLSNRFEEQIKFLQRHPEIDLCGTWVDLINEKGEVIGEKKYPTKDRDIKSALAWYPPLIHPTLMVKTQVYKQLKGYDPNFDLAEEYEFLLRARGKFRMTNISQKLLLWRLWEKRRSRKEMQKMDKIDLRIKIEALKRGYFGPLYILTVARKFLMTYFLPISLKVKIARLLKVA